MEEKNRIRECRAKYKITMAELAEKCGVCKQHIFNLEHDKQRPSLDLADRMAKALNTNSNYLFKLD